MMRALVLLAGLVLAMAARGAAQSQVEFTDHTPAEQQATAYLPGGTALPGEAIDGALAPVVEREVVFSGPVDVSLVGVTPGGELTLRHASGATLTVRVRCFWADASGDGGVRRWAEFNCFRAGPGAPPPKAGGARSVYLRAFVVAVPAQTISARAGRFSAGAYFRVDAM